MQVGESERMCKCVLSSDGWFGSGRGYKNRFNFGCFSLIKIESKACCEGLLCFHSPVSDSWVLEQVMGRVYVYVCTRCGSGHNRVAEGAKSLLGSSSPPVLFAFAFLSHAEHLRVRHRKSFSHRIHLRINQSRILRKHIPNLSVNWALH